MEETFSSRGGYDPLDLEALEDQKTICLLGSRIKQSGVCTTILSTSISVTAVASASHEYSLPMTMINDSSPCKKRRRAGDRVSNRRRSSHCCPLWLTFPPSPALCCLLNSSSVRRRATARTPGVARRSRVVDGGVTATGVLSRQRGNLITIVITRY